METLSNIFKKSDVFNEEFDKIFPAKPFTKVHILNYISACTDIVLNEARERFPSRGLKFINPLFVVDREIYPASNLHGDDMILRLTRPFYSLIQARLIVPLSIPIIDNLLSGVCLCYGNTYGECDYKLYKTFNLDELAYSIDFTLHELEECSMMAEVRNLKVDTNRFSDHFEVFAKDLMALTDDEKVKLIKTVVLYKNISKTIGPSLIYSFVNKYNQTRSFFDVMLSLISERPFDEDELLDFANIVESISLPISNYDFQKSKGISAQTMAKRNSLKSMIINSFREVY